MAAVLLLLFPVFLVIAGTIASFLMQPKIEAEDARYIARARQQQLVM